MKWAELTVQGTRPGRHGVMADNHCLSVVWEGTGKSLTDIGRRNAECIPERIPERRER